jgi:GTP-binding protein
LTKSDKLSRSALERNRKTLQTQFGLESGIPMIPFSALNRSGRDELWKAIVGSL